MSKKVVHRIKVSKEEFKKIKKGKQTFIIRLNDEENQKIKSKDKIVIKGKVDSFKKKLKEIHIYSTLEDLVNNVKKEQLGYKKKDNLNYEDLIKDYKKEDIKKYGILGIELRPKKHIFRKILLGILILVLLFFSYRFIRSKIDEMNVKKINSTINELAKEKIDYVFVEINPSFVLTIKDNKVSDVACLNDDCMSMYNDVDIKNKTISESIDNLFNLAKDKGFDTSNGVKIKTTIEIDVKGKDYIAVEFINEPTKNELLSQVKNNEEIKDNNNDDYYSNLWNELKKDKDYDKVYSCSMDNDILHCYILKDFIDTEIELGDPLYLVKYSELASAFFRTLDKFGVKYSTGTSFDWIIPGGITGLSGVFINGTEYSYISYQSGTTYYDNVLKYENNDITTLVPFIKFDLLTLQYDVKDAIVIDEWAY